MTALDLDWASHAWPAFQSIIMYLYNLYIYTHSYIRGVQWNAVTIEIQAGRHRPNTLIPSIHRRNLEFIFIVFVPFLCVMLRICGGGDDTICVANISPSNSEGIASGASGLPTMNCCDTRGRIKGLEEWWFANVIIINRFFSPLLPPPQPFDALEAGIWIW